MKRLLLFAVFCFGLLQSYAQEIKQIHVDDLLLQQKVVENPILINKYLIYESNLRNIISETPNAAKTDTLINGKRIVPVVFHIIHVGGVENISNAQIEDAMILLNKDYSRMNHDTADTYPLFKPRAADCQIEFRLAKVDPNGNCTDGIERINDPQTNYGYFKTMTDHAWPPSKYMNIFVVKVIYPEGMSLPDGAFIGGMSPFPPSNPLSQSLTGGDTLADGVLIRHDGIGSIGTATQLGGMPINALNRTFTHETGHYFNLYHPFQNLMFGLLPSSSGCPSAMAPDGDEVSDTPPVDVATQNISLNCYIPGSRNTCNQDVPDEPDMIENYMDYQWGYCTNMFSNGQLNRMNAALNTDRRLLWSYENLVATGVLDTNTSLCAPVADFYPEAQTVCSGSSLDFGDYSYNGNVAAWNWTFEGGTPATSTNQNPTVTYNTPGTYFVKLIVSNANGMDSLVKQDLIHVYDAATATQTPYKEDFESLIIAQPWMVSSDAGNEWEITNSVGFSGNKCIRLSNFDNNPAGSYDEFITEAYDFTTLPGGSPSVLRFQLAYAGKIIPGTILTPADTAYDELQVLVSTDCGTSWSSKLTLKGAALATANPIETEFTPSATDWSQETIMLNPYGNDNNVKVKFVFHGNGGNSIYVDDIQIENLLSSVDENEADWLDLKLMPNPTNSNSTISFNLFRNENVKLEVMDMIGKQVAVLHNGALSSGNHQFSVSKDQLQGSGIYFLRICVGDIQMSRKLVITE